MSNRRSFFQGLLVLVVLAGGLVAGGCTKRKHNKIRHDRLEEKSKTPACKKELAVALENLRATLGLGFTPAPSDTKYLFDKGYIRKGYARDGAQFTVSFGLKLKDGSCYLRMFRRTRSRPNEHHTHTGDFGAVKLKTCTCQ